MPIELLKVTMPMLEPTLVQGCRWLNKIYRGQIVVGKENLS
jgi:hypothetical protein